VKFWDASAVVPLLIAEESTRRLQALAAKDSAMLVWWASAVECISALARLERDGALNPAAMTLALQRLHKLSAGWPRLIQATKSGKQRHDFCAYTRCAPPMRYNWQRPSQQLSDGQRHWR